MSERDSGERPQPPADGPTGTFVRGADDGSDRSASSLVVESVATAVGTDPTELQPLYEVVDPDALDLLAGSGARAGATGGCRVSFRYEGCDVTIEADGRTTVVPPDVDTV